MKFSDVVIDFLQKKGLKRVFVITGGASIHLIDSLGNNNKIDYICMHHEQACGMAADGYSRVSDSNIGAAISTSGPGATNLITAIACSWFDSVPVIYITGQVTRFRMKKDLGVRQIGFQETDIVPMVKNITKYAKQILRPNEILYELEKSYQIAINGRQGPVLIDIPDDIQRMNIKRSDLKDSYFEINNKKNQNSKILKKKIDKILINLELAKRPILITGSGINSSKSKELVIKIRNKLNIPVAPTWASQELWNIKTNLSTGSFGTHGTRSGNFAVQNADFILCIGARLGTRETGHPLKSFAREAKIALVDIDKTEINKFKKFGKKIDIPINADSQTFLEHFDKRLKYFKKDNFKWWAKKINEWKVNFPVVSIKYKKEKSLNPYVFFSSLSSKLSINEIIYLDTGSTVAWAMQAFKFNGKQRVIHDFNNTAMGYALPASIGGSFSNVNNRVSCIVGDGSLMMNVQELATVSRYNLPIAIFIINNDGYSMVQQTQEQWLKGQYHATSYEGGLSFPNYKALAKSFNIKYVLIEKNEQVGKILSLVNKRKEPLIIELKIDRWHRVTPQSRFGYPIEDADPLLSRDIFLKNMIVEPLKVSLK